MLRIKGLNAPVFTPLTADGKLDLDKIADYAQHLSRHGVPNIYVGGTSSEFASFSLNERKAINAEWIKQAKKHLSGHVVVHVGSSALCDAQELARHAVDAGADAIASVSPFYSTPQTVEAMIAYFKELTQAVPNTPFLYYHIPTLVRCPVDLTEFLSAATEAIPTLAGVKYADDDMSRLRVLQQQFGDRLQIFNGFEHCSLEAMKLGVIEGACSSYTIMLGPHKRMREAFIEGDTNTAEKESIYINNVIDIVRKYASNGLPAALKDTARLAGLDVGPTRLPLLSMSEDTLKKLRQDLEAIDFFKMNNDEVQ